MYPLEKIVSKKQPIVIGSYLTATELQEFKSLIKENLEIELTDEQAQDQGSRLVMLMETMQKFQPILLSQKDVIVKENKKNENTGK